MSELEQFDFDAHTWKFLEQIKLYAGDTDSVKKLLKLCKIQLFLKDNILKLIYLNLYILIKYLIWLTTLEVIFNFILFI